MKVKMLVDAPGSPDGVTVNQYAKGEEYDVPDSLAITFAAEGFAEAVEPADDRLVTYVLDLPPLPVQKPKRGRGAAPRENK